MILNYSWAVWLAWILGGAFAFVGLARLAGLAPAWSSLLPRGRSPAARVIGGILCVAVGLMIAWYPSRPFGLLFGLLLCAAALVTLLRIGDARRLPLPCVIAALVVLAAWGLRLI